MYKLMSGNEAIAQGAYEAGVSVAVAYPGTPSTEILENIATYEGIKAQWSPNEKVAMEVGAGASIGGARVLVSMKHVGVNVAADPLLTFAYTGVNGGLVLISADDPGMHSSQNEQDNRYYGYLAKIPVIEPSSSQEAKDYIKKAFEMSEKFDTPVILRITTRIAHSKGRVLIGQKEDYQLKEYDKNPAKYVMVPQNARKRHLVVEERRKKLEEAVNDSVLNIEEMNDAKIGFITSGISYQYIKEVLPEASVLKIGTTWPIPKEMIKSFAEKVQDLYVFEELEPIIENQIKAMGIEVKGKDVFPRTGEYNEDILRRVFGRELPDNELDLEESLPVRPPVLCPGCPHRGVFYVLKKNKINVSGDIGCYALGAAPPLSSMDTCICMGASISALLGMEKARGREFAKKSVAVIGDSTFFHSGMTGLVDIVYNGGTSTVLVLDNSTTAMTGHQDNPGTGKTLKGDISPVISIENVAKAIGIQSVKKVSAFDLVAFENTLKEELLKDKSSVIIVEHPCALLEKSTEEPYGVDYDACVNCKMCLQIGCPAISNIDGKIVIDPLICVGCGLCEQVCPMNAMKKVGEING